MSRIGLDLVSVADVQHSLDEFGAKFLARVFTDDEVRACAGDPRRLAGRLAAKEAAIKALRLGPDEPTPPREVEVIGAGRAPELRLHGGLAERAREQGWCDVQVSITHTDCHAAAVVLVELRQRPGGSTGPGRTAPTPGS